MKMRLIDADALIDELGISDEDIIFEGMLEDAPTIDAVPVRHGRWIEHYKSDAPPMLKERWICSWCGNVQTYGATGYCPNCGAKMDGEDNE